MLCIYIKSRICKCGYEVKISGFQSKIKIHRLYLSQKTGNMLSAMEIYI